MRAFFHAFAAPFRALADPDGRRAWALIFMAGGAFTMTVYAAVALWLVRKNPGYAFSLGIAAHVTIVLVLTGFVGLLVKRTVKVSDGKRVLDISDAGDATEAIVAPPNPS